ncbi:MAG: P-loop NTPase [Betaproteobacteria bacterium]|nr:P-loop NTPase [Betaproteobacteria bacterium]
MSLIEQAAKRLDQLRSAGITPPAGPAASPAPAGAGPAPESAAPSAERVAPGPAVTSARVELDLHRLADEGLVTPNEPRSMLAEQFRIIKRPLLANVAKAGEAGIARANLIGVTSALPGEGKSFTSLNLAMSIAMELDRSVLLVDADVVRPSLPRMLGLPPGPGLLDLLGSPPAQFSRALLRTNVDKLAFLPAGTLHPKAAEMLASDAMSALLEEIAARYADRVVIFDSPPLLVTTESRVLASRLGQVVFVVRAGRTLQSQVTHALATIESCPIKLLLLNGTEGTSEGGYGYGGYDYGYGYGQGAAE